MSLLPEWVQQDAVILAWPDEQTDWAPWLTDVEDVYCNLIREINLTGAAVLLLVREQRRSYVQQRLADATSVLILTADYNDTWARDYAFLTLADGQPIELIFNGWGNKFDATKDNLINQQVFAALLSKPLKSIDLVCEGGAVEIDDTGHLLSTALCLRNPQRNADMTLAEYAQCFEQEFGASRVSIYENGHLQGDDTDGHIDTLVRFAPNNVMVVQSCYNRPQDEHYEGLAALVAEVRKDRPDCDIVELPLPRVMNQDGERLPASYANYLIVNGRVLCPTYQQDEDAEALSVIRIAYPDYQVVGVNCLPLVQQFGSLHCITMQVPRGVLKPHVIDQFGTGVVTL